MDSQKTQKLTLPKKKVKNKGWNSVVDNQQPQSLVSNPIQAIPSPYLQLQHNKNHKNFSSIQKLSQKYTFNINSVLGSGFASVVYLGQKITDRSHVCIKAIDLLALGLSSQHAKLILNQIQIQMKLDSEYIVKLYDVYQSNTFYYLVMELCVGGNLYRMLKISPADLPCKFVDIIMQQITRGICQFHDKAIIHRDLKTQNILIYKFPENQKQTMKVKIGDLGFCVYVQELQKMMKQGKNIENVGSPIYMSPQVMKSQKYSYSSDIYSLGIIWYELLHKKAPWEAKSEQELLQKKLQIQPKKWRADILDKTKQIIIKCISNNAEDRPTCHQILKSFIINQK